MTSPRLFHGFLEAAPDAVVIVNGGGTIVQVNSQTENLFGYHRDELLGQPLKMLMPERFRGAHDTKVEGYLADPHPRPMGRGLELLGMRKDGGEFPIDVSISPLPGEGEPLVSSTIRDMTLQRQLENELHRRAGALEEADRQKDNFLSAVAHELRSPLGVLAVVADLLRNPTADAAAREEALGALKRQVLYMSCLVEDLLDLSRVRCGDVTMRRQPVDLSKVIFDAIEMVRPLFEERKHRLEVADFSGSFRVNGDPLRLVQVVSNVLTNAAKYTPEGGQIRLSAAREGDALVIRVRDNGLGIQKEMLSRVFDLFCQCGVSRDGQRGGLGIGLTLVRHLIELHEGSVEAISEGHGKGSEFVLRLPPISDGTDSNRPGRD